jgi:hypothetical protein
MRGYFRANRLIMTIWEDAVDRGYVARETLAGTAVRVAVTEGGGARFLRVHGRVS